MAGHEIEPVPEDEVKQDGDNGSNSLQPDTAFLLEMNLLTVFLSLFSLSGEDGEDGSKVDPEERKVVRDNEAKACISRLHTRRNETGEVKLGRRPNQRFQAIKDLRHCRRM